MKKHTKIAVLTCPPLYSACALNPYAFRDVDDIFVYIAFEKSSPKKRPHSPVTDRYTAGTLFNFQYFSNCSTFNTNTVLPPTFTLIGTELTELMAPFPETSPGFV